MRVLNARQMRDADRQTVEDLGVPSIVLMENAGRQVVAAMHATYNDVIDRRISILCGRGNNGGDGLVVARILWHQGVQVKVFLLAQEDTLSPDAQINYRIARRLSLPVVEVHDSSAWEDASIDALDCELLVDAILGTGIGRALEGFLKVVVADVNASDVPVVSVDMPTGLLTDDSGVAGDAITADVTVTLATPKPSLLLPPADAWAGDLVIADIGIPKSVIERIPGPRLSLLTADDIREIMPVRPQSAHKGQFGHILIVAGSLGKSGAAALAGRAALRSGAGLVTVATPESVVDIVTAATPECMTLPLPVTSDGTLSAAALQCLIDFECDVIAAGPGLGNAPGVVSVVRGLLNRPSTPIVLDADALNVLATEPDVLDGNKRKIIITPHPGEMSRLIASSVGDVQNNRLGVAQRFAIDHRLHVVLKGARTIITDPEGNAWLNLTGNPGMATAGVGDVLTGVIAAWLAQTGRPDVACQLGVYLHGLAGDLASHEHGEVALIASDLIDAMGKSVAATTEADEVSYNGNADLA